LADLAEAPAHLGIILSGVSAVPQAPLFHGLSFIPFALKQNGLISFGAYLPDKRYVRGAQCYVDSPNLIDWSGLGQ